MTVCVFIVIIVSILYYLVVFSAEVFGHTPKCVLHWHLKKQKTGRRGTISSQKRGSLEMSPMDMYSNPMGKNRRQSNGIDDISEEAKAAIIEAERARHEEKIEPGHSGRSDFIFFPRGKPTH